MLALMIASTDAANPDFKPAWQNILLGIFLDSISVDGRRKLSRGHPSGRYCTHWEGIRCQEGIVDEILFLSVDYGNFNICALPYTTASLFIVNCQQSFELHTRSLPRRLVFISLARNQIRGRVDLSTLPPALVKSYLSRNKLEGPIDLTHLPQTLEVLDLHGNRITQHTVWYDNLPKNIESIRLHGEFQKKDISEVRAVDPTREVVPSIFKGVKVNSFRKQ